MCCVVAVRACNCVGHDRCWNKSAPVYEKKDSPRHASLLRQRKAPLIDTAAPGFSICWTVDGNDANKNHILAQ